MLTVVLFFAFVGAIIALVIKLARTLKFVKRVKYLYRLLKMRYFQRNWYIIAPDGTVNNSTFEANFMRHFTRDADQLSHITYSIQTVECDDDDDVNTSLAFIYKTSNIGNRISTNSWYYRYTGRYLWERLTQENIVPPVQDADTKAVFRKVFNCGYPQSQIFIDRVESVSSFIHVRTMSTGTGY